MSLAGTGIGGAQVSEPPWLVTSDVPGYRRGGWLLSARWIGATALFLLTFLNILNYSPIGWLASGQRVAYLRLPLVVVATGFLLVWRGHRLTGILARNYDVLLFATWAVLGSAAGHDRGRALLYASWLIVSLLFLLLYVLLWRDVKELLRYSARIFVVAYAFPLALGIASIRSYSAGDTRLSGSMDIDQVHAWAAVIVAASLLVYNALGNRESSRRDLLRRPIVVGGTVFVALVDVALSGTRAAAAALVVVLIGYLLSGTAARWKRVATAVVLAVGVAVVSQHIHSSTVDRYRELTTPGDLSRSDNLRLEIWQANIAQALEHPLFGGGLLSSTQVATAAGGDVPDGMSAHGTYIEIFSEMGVVGAILFLLIVTRSLRMLFRRAELRELRWHILLLLAGPAIISIFEANLTPGQALFFPLWTSLLIPRAVVMSRSRVTRSRPPVATQL